MSSRTPDHQRLAANPTKWPSLARGAAVKVYMGSQWASGSWQGLQGDRGAIWVGKEQRLVLCADARNVRPA